MVDPILGLAMIGLIAGIGFSVEGRLESLWVPVFLVPLGILVTATSALLVSVTPANFGDCTITYVGRGFPLPWNSAFDFAGSRCLPLLLPSTVGRDMISFALDVIFYIAAGIAIIQLYRGIEWQGKPPTKKTS